MDRSDPPDSSPPPGARADLLRVYEVRVSEDAKLSAGAFKTGTHDDMATALGLACLFDPTGELVRYWANPFETTEVRR